MLLSVKQSYAVHRSVSLFSGYFQLKCGAVFVWDFPHLVNAREIYFFIYLSTREKCLSRGFYLSREDWIPVDVFSLCIVRQPFLFSDFGFWRTYTEFHNCFQGKDNSFSIFTRSLRALTFQFCCGSFTINLSRKAITFVHLVCVLSFII